jgi:hypothetical protein
MATRHYQEVGSGKRACPSIIAELRMTVAVGGRTYAALAQLVEHLSCKQVVVGSIPTGGSMGIAAGR